MDDSPARLSENDARKLVNELTGGANVPAEVLIPRLKDAGLSLRQIAKLTGFSLGIVRKY